MLLSCVGSAAAAQQAIVTMPSADITPEGQMFFMHETQARPWQPGPYWNSTHFLTYGTGGDLELTATLFNVEAPFRDRATLALGFKKLFRVARDALPALELGVTFGTKVVVPFAGQPPGHWTYGHVSGRVPGLDTRVAMGASYATAQLKEVDALSFIASVEQPLGSRKLNLVAEWFSGQHDFGNLIFGLTYHPNHTWIFVAGFKVPTSGTEFAVNKHAVVLEVGVFWDVLVAAR